MILWHRLDLEDKRAGGCVGGGEWGGGILEMAFNMAQWPCRGIQYSH